MLYYNTSIVVFHSNPNRFYGKPEEIQVAMLCDVQSLFQRAQACAVSIRMSGGAAKAGNLLQLLDPDFHTTVGNLREHYWKLLTEEQRQFGNITLITFEAYVQALEAVLWECCVPAVNIPLARFYLLYQQRAGQVVAI